MLQGCILLIVSIESNVIRIMASRSRRWLGHVQLYEKCEMFDYGSRKEYLGDIPFMGGKGKGKVHPCTGTEAVCTGRTAHRASRGIALPFHDHGTRRE